MTQPRDFPENRVRYRTDDVVKGVYVFQEHVDPATNPYPLPGLDRTHTLAGSRVQPRRVRLLGRPADRRIDMASRMDLALTAVISFNLGIVYACMAIWLS
jgi:hypothetical protein